MLLLSVALTVVKSPLLLFQYIRSKQMAKAMLHNDQGLVLLQPKTEWPEAQNRTDAF